MYWRMGGPTPSTVVIGDVHGCGTELRTLLRRVDQHAPRCRLIFIGDLFTKGPQPDLVVSEILSRRARRQRIDLVCGNHELKLRSALRAHHRGVALNHLSGSSARALRTLSGAGMLDDVQQLLEEAVANVEISGGRPRWVCLHGGIDPRRGLSGTSDSVKVHRRAAPGARDWWWDYDGSEGLMIVGHKPLAEPLRVRRQDGRPIVVNVDTGCATGGALTAYWIERDRFLTVPSRQPSRALLLKRSAA